MANFPLVTSIIILIGVKGELMEIVRIYTSEKRGTPKIGQYASLLDSLHSVLQLLLDATSNENANVDLSKQESLLSLMTDNFTVELQALCTKLKQHADEITLSECPGRLKWPLDEFQHQLEARKLRRHVQTFAISLTIFGRTYSTDKFNEHGGGNVLYAAAEDGDEITVELLLEIGMDVNTEGGLHGNALQVASVNGHEAVVRLLLERESNINSRCGYYGNALSAAAFRGHEAVVKILLEHGADVNAVGGPRGNAMCAAVVRGHGGVVMQLLKKNVDVNAQIGSCDTALYSAAFYGDVAMVKLLIDNGADVNASGGQYGNPLQAASIDGHEDVVKLLIAEGADVNADGGFYGSAFAAADFLGHWSLAKLLRDLMDSPERKGVDIEKVINDVGAGGESADEFPSKSVEDFGQKDKFTPRKFAVEDMARKLCMLDDVYDKATDTRKIVLYDSGRISVIDDDEVAVPDKYDKWVLLLRRVFDRSNRLLKTMLDVNSPLIASVLKEAVKGEQAALESGRPSLFWPNNDIFRYRAKIQEVATMKGELAVKHVDVLMELIEQSYASHIKNVNVMFPKGISNYDILREIFRPGDIILNTCQDIPRAYRVIDSSYEENCWSREFYLDIDAKYIDFDGVQFGTVTVNFRIDKFEGVKYIHSLPVYPLRYHTDQRAITQQLSKRGRRFAALKGQNFKAHCGLAKTTDDKPAYVNSRAMIDTSTFNRLNPSFRVKVSSIAGELVGSELSEEHLLLCTSHIPLFSFQDKKFFIAEVDNVRDIGFNHKLIEQLVLPETQKELIRVLVKNHSEGVSFDDFVEGKGLGLILLLHGPPGVGKSMTAEAVAEFTERPLYAVTSGELGASPSELEKGLEKVLDLAKAFRAVLLLDEADVFMEKRATRDLKRNALVSIFLRLIEYYRGILFLTTNRIEALDEAFQSRIHISLHYAELTVQAREQIWRKFGEKAGDEAEFGEEDYKELANWEINGREIKNAFSSSKILATSKKEKISIRVVKQVLDIMTSFSLEDIKRGTRERRMQKWSDAPILAWIWAWAWASACAWARRWR